MPTFIPRTARARSATAGGVVLLLGVAGVTATHGEQVYEKLRGEHSAESLQEFVKEHPHLNARSGAVAFVREKLEQQGGEGSAEVLSGPNQEQYDARAFPRTAVAPAQQAGSRAAFVAVTKKGKGKGKGKGGPATGTWSFAGPTTGAVEPEATYTGTPANVAGRTTAMALAPGCSPTACTLYVASAGGGVWRSADALSATPTWTPIGSDIPSGAIGDMFVAKDGTLYVGTGEESGSSDSEAGVGLYRSADGGSSFQKIPTTAGGKDFALDRSIGAIAVDPTDARHLYVGTAVARHGASSVNGGRFTPPGAAALGLYESRDGGASWVLSHSETSDTVDPSSATGSDFFRGGVTKIELDPTTPSTVYASFSAYGVFRRTAGGDWSSIYLTKNAGSAALSTTSRFEFATTTLPDGRTRMYLGDATALGGVSGLLRSDDVTAAKPAFTLLSSADETSTGYDSYNFCQAQCSYDMVVTTPPGKPDEVFLSGSMNYDELFTSMQPSNGRAVVRSANAGVSFTDMTNDAAASPNGLHPDHHALVFVPGAAQETYFTGSDGGIVRGSGPYVDTSAACSGRNLSSDETKRCARLLSAVPTSNTDLNRGLNTLQFQSVSLGPDGTLQGGTQDNGTWESDAPSGFAESVGGDGGQSGFNIKDASIRYHSYYLPQHDVNFQGASPTGWDWISDPLLNSGEGASFYTPFVADPTVAGTVFDGLQHIWRTTDNGGDRAYLDKHCNEFTGDFKESCGDWQPLGGTALNGAGDLSGTAYGSDFAGAANYVVAITRAPRTDNVMWAGTRRGRLFVSQNANAADTGAVAYRRVDLTAVGDKLPTRFVTGIAVDPKDANHAFVSYSGYSAYAAGGHVYELRYDPRTGTVRSTDRSLDLGDQPITSVVYDYRTGSVFASTDFGVLGLAAGGTGWAATSGLPTVATYGLTLDPASKRLYAATHGRGIWQYRIS